jgi:hypothetical protein
MEIMADLNSVERFKQLLMSIQSILKSLNGKEHITPDLLQSRVGKFKELNTLYRDIVKYTHDGNFSPALRIKFKKLISWKDNLNKLLEQESKMKKHQNTTFDIAEVEQYVDYIEKIEYFVESCPGRISLLKEMFLPLEKPFQFLAKNKNWNKFQLQESDVISADLLKSDDNNAVVKEKAVQVATPTNTLKMVKASINEFAKMIKRVKTHLFRINELITELSSPPLEEILSGLNQKNLLIKKLLQQLSEINRLIYTSKFENELLIRRRYEELLKAVSRHLPAFLVAKFALPEKNQIEELTDSSIGGLKNQMNQDRSVGKDFVSPWIQQQVPNKPKVPSSPIPTGQYEKHIKENKVSPEEKSKYEKLWNE